MHILVKDLAVCERPYEKAEQYGVSALSDAELLSSTANPHQRGNSSDLGKSGIKCTRYAKRITWIAVFAATGIDENPRCREGQSHPASCTGRDIQTDESRTIAKKTGISYS